MPKVARWDGVHPTQVFPSNDVYARPITVEPGHHLPHDLPQAMHREIGEMDNWTLVEYNPPGSKAGSDEKKGGE